MADDARAPRWWQTLPGLVTAVATLVTAAGGLLVILAQTGMIGGTIPAAAPEKTPRSTADVAGGGPANPASRGDDSSPQRQAAGLKPWGQSEVVVTRRDGQTMTVRAETFSNCLTGRQKLALASGQEVAFGLMRSIDVVESDPVSAAVVITLHDGRALADRTAANCDLFGFNTLGRASVLFKDVKRVDFRR
jgi:hypothetical protein